MARGMSPHRRVPFLVAAAAVGAIGVSVLTPSAQADDGTGQIANRQAALVLAAASTSDATDAQDANGTTDSAQALSAAVVARARSRTLAATHSPAPATAHQFPATPDGFRAYALSQVGAAQFSCLDPLWEKESHWRPEARNPASTAYGIAQLLDGTWRYTGLAKTSDGFRQVDAGIAYLRRAYPGGPCGAWAHERAVGWY